MKPLFILGATATGKSALALALARILNPRRVAILSLDAMQVYRGADIGTSKATPAEQAEFPHGGIDLVPLGQAFSVADYLKHAGQFIASHADRHILIVGGTGLYYRALTRGLCLAPEAPAELRAELNSLTISELQTRLREKDPTIYAKLDSHNPRRLARALEVIEFTGKSLLQWQAETPKPLIVDGVAVHVTRPKAELRRRIVSRVRSMFESGWIAEVRELLAIHSAETLTRFAAIGYPAIAQSLASNPKLAHPSDALIEAIALETQHYAKRQLTWFNREPDLKTCEISLDNSPSADQVLITISRLLEVSIP